VVTIVTNNGAPSPLVSGDGGQRMAISVAKSSAVVWLIASDCRASVILAGVAGVLDLVGLIGLGEGEVFGVVADGRGDGSFEGGGDGSVEAGGGQQVGPEGEPLGDGDGRGDGRPVIRPAFSGQFQTAIYAAALRSRYSLWTSCGVR